MIGRKLYYELATGDVILEVPEKHGENAINTIKEQDFQMYDVLQARNPETIGVKQLEYGEKAGDFQKARSVKIDINTGEVLFEYPVFYPSHSEQIAKLNFDNIQLQEQIDQLTIMLGDALLEGGI